MEDGRCARSLEIAASFGIKVSETDPFWKDRTFLELNYAVSFRSGVGATRTGDIDWRICRPAKRCPHNKITFVITSVDDQT